jgi:hypothetical protein
MKSLVSTALLRGLMDIISKMSDPSPQLVLAFDLLNAEDAIFMLDESYEIAKIFNTPTHQVVMLKSFEEEAIQGEFDPNGEEDFGEDGPTDYIVDYNTMYQIKQIMFEKGVRVARSFNYEEEAKRDEVWAKMSQDHAQKFVDATIQLMKEATDENSDQ